MYKRFQRHRIRLTDGDLLDSSTLDRIVESASKGQSCSCCGYHGWAGTTGMEALRQPERLGQEQSSCYTGGSVVVIDLIKSKNFILR